MRQFVFLFTVLLPLISVAGTIIDIDKTKFKNVEVSHSANILCAINAKLKDANGIVLEEQHSDTREISNGKIRISFSSENIEHASYAFIHSECALSVLWMLGNEELFVFEKNKQETEIPASLVVNVILLDNVSMQGEVHRKSFELFKCEDIFRNPDSCFTNDSKSSFDLIKFKNK